MMQQTLDLTIHSDGVPDMPQTKPLSNVSSASSNALSGSKAVNSDSGGGSQSESSCLSSSPDFEIGAIAFYRGTSGRVYPCQIHQAIATGKGLAYRVCDSLGLWLTFEATALLSGWEEDFPTHEAIEWGHFQPVSTLYECDPGEEAEYDRDDFFDEYGNRDEDLLSLVES